MQLPPLQVTRAVIQRYARLIHRYGDDLGTRPLVVPNSTYFPDTFRGDEESVTLLAQRMQTHAGMADIPIRCRVVTPGTPPAQSSSCNSGTCGVPMTSGSGLERLVDQGESWLLQVPVTEIKHPVALTTNLARSLAFVFLVETQKEDELLEPPVDVTADLLAVALGFGPIMLQGSYIYAKSCGGPQIASVTKIPVAELAVAVALFAALGEHKLGATLKELDITQRAGLTEAARLMTSNKQLISRIRKSPGEMARIDFPLGEARSFISQILSRFRRVPAHQSLDAIDVHMDLDEVESLLIDMPPSSRAGRTGPRPTASSNPEQEELKSLVAESLKEVRV